MSSDVHVDRLLDRLNDVKKIGSGKWRACCPAHDSSRRSLAITDHDGRILFHCFAGCASDAVLSSIGLTFRDLYAEPLGEFPPLKRSPFNARDVLDLVVHEAMTLSIIASDFLHQGQISTTDAERLFRATSRLNQLSSVVSRECR